MKIYNGIDENMITDFVAVLPRYCLYCGGKCWRVDSYPYGCRCSNCSAYFHCEFKTCDDYNIHFCTRQHNLSTLRLFELNDGTLVEVCQGCAEYLYNEGFISDSISDAFNDIN